MADCCIDLIGSVLRGEVPTHVMTKRTVSAD